MLDEARGAMRAREQLDTALVEQRPQLGERALEPARHLECVRSVLAPDLEQHPRLAVDRRVSELRLGPVQHPRDVPQPDARPAAVADDDLAHFVRRERLPLGLEADPLGLGLDEPGAEDSRRLARRGDHVGDRQIVGDQALREELDLDLADFPAELDHARHPWHAEQAGPHRPVGEGPQLHAGAYVGS